MIAFQRATDQLEGVIMGKPHGDAVPEASNNSAFVELIADGNTDLANKVRQFQFRDIRPKAASEIDDITHAGRLLGHSKEEMTKRVYRRVGEVVSPTK
ncbi:site-specific integrase [Pseudomonas fulva]|nr:integrase [Pseudomonas fulva]